MGFPRNVHASSSLILIVALALVFADIGCNAISGVDDFVVAPQTDGAPIDTSTTPEGATDTSVADATADGTDASNVDAIADGANEISTADATVDGARDAMPAMDGTFGDGNPGPPVTYTCPGKASVSDCSACNGYPLGCVYCHKNKFVGVCLQKGLTCQSQIPPSDKMCSCTSATSCPLANQVCISGVGCGTCGQNGSAGLGCQSGGTCDMATSACN